MPNSKRIVINKFGLGQVLYNGARYEEIELKDFGQVSKYQPLQIYTPEEWIEKFKIVI